MQVTALIPTVLRKFSRNESAVRCNGATVAEALGSLEESCPGLRERLCDENDQPRRFVNFYLNDEDIRFLEGGQTRLKDGDVITIVPALAGG